LGSTRGKAGSAEEFIKQDHDLIVKVAQTAHQAKIRSFQLVSSVGVDPNAYLLYPQSKGQTEVDVTAIGFPSLAIWRPSFLDTKNYPRANQRWVETVALGVWKTVFLPFVSNTKYRHILVEDVAKAMIKDSLSDRTGTKIYDGSRVILDFVYKDKNTTANAAPATSNTSTAGLSDGKQNA